MMIDFYMHPLSPPCRAVAMTAQHLHIQLNEKFIDILAGDTKKPEFLKMNTVGTVPTIDDGGFYLWESRPIMSYLVNKYAPGNSIYPEDSKLRALVDRMLYFDAGTLYKAIIEILAPVVLKGELFENIEPEKIENLKKAFILYEGILCKTKYAAGNHITIADFSIGAGITSTKLFDFSLADYPKICEWLQRLINEIPSFEDINIIPIKNFLESKKSTEK